MKSNNSKKTIKAYNPIIEEDFILNKEISELNILLWDIGIMTLGSLIDKRRRRILFDFPIHDAERFINVVCKDHDNSIYQDIIISGGKDDWQYDIFVNDFNESINENDELQYSGPPELAFCMSIIFPSKYYTDLVGRVKEWQKEYISIDNYFKIKEKEEV
jgi:hypothetical protein